MCTHHLRGAFRGLYLRYFFRHSILSKQRVQRPTFGNAMILADFLLFLLCLNANEFLCFGAVFLRSPFRKLMVPKWYFHCRQNHAMQRRTLNPPQKRPHRLSNGGVGPNSVRLVPLRITTGGSATDRVSPRILHIITEK